MPKLTLTGECTVELDVAEDGSVTGRVIGVIAGELPLPGQTQNVIATVVTDDQVTLVWDDSPDAETWKVYRDDVLLAEVDVPTYTDLAVAADTEYSYTILAHNDFGDSATYSEALVVTTEAPGIPEVPTNFELIEVTAASVTFSWSDSAGVVDYQILRDGVEVAVQTSSFFLDDELTPSTSYSYVVVARNSEGEASSAPFVVFTEANTPPTWLVAGFPVGTVGVAFSVDLNSVTDDIDGDTLTFSVVSGALPTGYTLVGSLLQGTPTTASTFTPVMGVSDGHSTTNLPLIWVIQAAADVTPPSIPTNVLAVANGSTVTVTWTASTDASGIRRYRVRRDNSFLSFADASPFIQSGVPDGTYSYEVRSEDNANFPANGNMSADSAASVVVVSSSINPDVPINFAGVWATATQINLSWAAGPSGPVPDDYDLDFSLTGASGPWTAITFVGTATTYSHTGRTNVNHWYRVRAKNGLVSSPYTASLNVTPQSSASRVIWYDGSLRDGRTNAMGNLNSGGRYGCKFQPEGGINTWADPAHALIQAGCLSTTLDQHVVGPAGETWDGVLVPPRKPNTYFLRQVLYFHKEYECVNNHVSPGAGVDHIDDKWDKSRCYWGLNAGHTNYGHDFDRECWEGFSIFLHPTNPHNDIEGVVPNGRRRRHEGGPAMHFLEASDNYSYMIMNLFGAPTVRPANYSGPLGGNTVSWNLWYMTNETSINQSGHEFESPFTHWINIGNVTTDEDIGKWTDFVFRYRINPFTTDKNGSQFPQGKNHLYFANRGILQVWKSKGPYLDANRNRQMVKVVDIFNAPFGSVPNTVSNVSGPGGGTYDYGWKKNPTGFTGPRYYGRAQRYWGFRRAPLTGEFQHQQPAGGTKDVDVNPSGLPLPGWVEQTPG